MRFQTPRKSAAAEVQVFLVSKQVRDEALERYESQNHFVVPVMRLPFCFNYFGHLRWPICHAMNSLCSSSLRSISISVDHRQWNGSSLNSVTCWKSLGSRQYQSTIGGTSNTSRNITKLRHDLETDEICDEAAWFISEIFVGFPQMRKLQLNVENAYCRVNCHRLVDLIFSREREWILKLADCQTRKFETLDFLGTINAEERDLIRHRFPENFQGCITFHGAFEQPDGDLCSITWDPSVEIHDTPPGSWTSTRWNPPDQGDSSSNVL